MPAPEAQYDSTGTYDVEWGDLDIDGDIVAVQPIKEAVSKGGILIADVGDAQSVRWGVVLAVGPGKHNDFGTFEKMRYQVGDVVMYGKFQSGGEPMIVGGRECLMFRQNDFVGRLRRDKPLRVVA